MVSDHELLHRHVCPQVKNKEETRIPTTRILRALPVWRCPMSVIINQNFDKGVPRVVLRRRVSYLVGLELGASTAASR